MQRKRKVPLRKCVVCEQMKPKKELLRIVKTPENKVFIDLTGKMSGRGAYLCDDPHCFETAKTNRALDRALRYSVQQELYDQLTQKHGKKDTSNHDRPKT